MAVDFSEIDELVVGWEPGISPNFCELGEDRNHTLKELTFREFIKPYSRGTEQRWEVYANLREGLSASIEEQSLRAEREQEVRPEVLAIQAFQRESIKNAMQLIDEKYLRVGNIHNAPYFRDI